MKLSYCRFEKNPPRLITEKRFRMIRARIGYLCRAGVQIHSKTWMLSDEACRDGAVLRLPPQSFADVYYNEMQPKIRNDADIEMTAVYFDPYSGRFIVVGSRALYADATAEIGAAGTPLFLEAESPVAFDALSYGEYADPDTLSLSYRDYFVPDVTGHTLLDYAVRRSWDGDTKPRRCVLSFFDENCAELLENATGAQPDLRTDLLAAIVLNGNARLLAQLFALVPQFSGRFRLNIREESKFAGNAEHAPITLPESFSAPPVLFNLFQYTVLCGDPDTVRTLFSFYERPLELKEFIRHPMYFHLGFALIREGNAAVLSGLLAAGFPYDCTDAQNGRMPLLSETCIFHRPAITAMLVSAGADVMRKDSNGKTPLDFAISENDPACLAELLRGLKGTDISGVPVVLSARITLDDETQALAYVIRAYTDEHKY